MNKKIAALGLFASLAIIFGYVESLFPILIGNFGIKLGLANLSVLFILDRYGFAEAYAVSVIRIIVIAFLFPKGFTITFSLAGATLSLLIMTFMLRKTNASIYAVSMTGGIMHNIGQLIVALWVMQSPQLLFYYTPVLLVSGILTGLIIGHLTVEVSKRIPK